MVMELQQQIKVLWIPEGVRAAMAPTLPVTGITYPDTLGTKDPWGYASHNWDMITGSYETMDGECA